MSKIDFHIDGPKECTSSVEGQQREGSTINNIISTRRLRSTINKRSGLVENLDDRRAWNQWILLSSSKILDTPTPTTTDCFPDNNEGLQLLEPGSYEFAYRSYVNFEESGAIKKRLYHLPTWLWGYIQPSPGIMTVHEKQNNNGEDQTTTNDDDDLPVVTMKEMIRFKIYKLISIKWEGYFDTSSGYIHWTNSEMMIQNYGLQYYCDYFKSLFLNSSPVNPTTEVISRPDASERLRQIPWKVIRMEDGMVAFRRGDVGVLVYDRITDDS
jgi:hypothetical protein